MDAQPALGRGAHSRCREEAVSGFGWLALVLALAVLVLVLLGATGGIDDEADLIEHDRWMQELKEDGAWVMW